jgi:four helix bundle protein
MATFRDLLIWQKSMLVVTDIYAVTNSLLPRSTLSTIEAKCNFNPSNIAEGYGRQGTKDYLKF